MTEEIFVPILFQIFLLQNFKWVGLYVFLAFDFLAELTFTYLRFEVIIGQMLQGEHKNK